MFQKVQLFFQNLLEYKDTCNTILEHMVLVISFNSYQSALILWFYNCWVTHIKSQVILFNSFLCICLLKHLYRYDITIYFTFEIMRALQIVSTHKHIFNHIIKGKNICNCFCLKSIVFAVMNFPLTCNIYQYIHFNHCVTNNTHSSHGALNTKLMMCKIYNKAQVMVKKEHKNKFWKPRNKHWSAKNIRLARHLAMKEQPTKALTFKDLFELLVTIIHIK